MMVWLPMVAAKVQENESITGGFLGGALAGLVNVADIRAFTLGA